MHYYLRADMIYFFGDEIAQTREFEAAFYHIKERFKMELSYINREIEKAEKERAFLLAKRTSIENTLAELSVCLKG